MGIPDLISSAITTSNEQILAKMNRMENNIDRNLDVAIRKQEFYKGNYNKEIGDIFDYWTDLISTTNLKDNNNLTPNEKTRATTKYDKLTNIVKAHEMSVKTLKYAGPESTFALAINRSIAEGKTDNNYLVLYGYVHLFCCLKKETTGIDISPLEVLMIYTNDILDEKEFVKLKKAKKSYKEKYDEICLKRDEVRMQINDTFIDVI